MGLPNLDPYDLAIQTIADRTRMARKKGKFTSMGVCVFAGAFSFGAEDAGFVVPGHLESDDLTLGSKVAQQRWNVAQVNYTKWTTDVVEQLRRFDGIPDGLHMNPPCSAYAKNGKRQGLEDPIMCYVKSCHALGLAMEPSFFTWELVPGIFIRDLEYIEHLAKECYAKGYFTYAFLTNSALHGAPQARERFHFVASKFPIDFVATYDIEPLERKGWRPVSEPLAEVEKWIASGKKVKNHLDSVGNGQLDGLVKFTPPGTYMSQLPDKTYMENYTKRGGVQWQPGHNQPGVSRIRVMPDKPCPVIVGGNTIAHPTEDRFMTVRELATVMGFPMDYEFTRGKSTPYKEVGRGLCRENAAFLMRAIHDAISANSSDESPEKELIVVDWRAKAEVPKMTSPSSYKKKWCESRGMEWGFRTKARASMNDQSRKRVSVGKVVTFIGTPPEGLEDRLKLCGVKVGEGGKKFAFAKDMTELMYALVALGAGGNLVTDLPVPSGLPVNVITGDPIQSVLDAMGVGLLPLITARLAQVSEDDLSRVLNFINELLKDVDDLEDVEDEDDQIDPDIEEIDEEDE